MNRQKSSIICDKGTYIPKEYLATQKYFCIQITHLYHLESMTNSMKILKLLLSADYSNSFSLFIFSHHLSCDCLFALPSASLFAYVAMVSNLSFFLSFQTVFIIFAHLLPLCENHYYVHQQNPQIVTICIYKWSYKQNHQPGQIIHSFALRMPLVAGSPAVNPSA